MGDTSPENLEPQSISDRLATERTREAAERTLLAWIRTSLSLISFGFAIYKVVEALYHREARQHVMTFLIGCSFILLGIVSMSAATLQYLQILKRLHLASDPYKPSWSLGVLVGMTLVMIGILALATIMVQFWVNA